VEFVALTVPLDFTKLLLINVLLVMELAELVRVMPETAQAVLVDSLLTEFALETAQLTSLVTKDFVLLVMLNVTDVLIVAITVSIALLDSSNAVTYV
jgi:hypothetical protein